MIGKPIERAPKQGMMGASNFHLLGVGAEKSSSYRLGLLGFDAYLIIRERGALAQRFTNRKVRRLRRLAVYFASLHCPVL